ncbi:MAG: lytic transglycosylase domain-containing protein, partial [Clostridium sp.]
GDYDLVLAAYNGGPGNVSRWLGDAEYSDDGVKLRVIPFDETKKYVKRVKLNYTMYKYLYDLNIK